MACELYCCLLPQCEALRTCRLGFPIATKWCCDQDRDVERWVFTRQKKQPPVQDSSVLRVAFCLLRALHPFCFLASCRFANCAICSLVAGIAQMVYGYRIIMLRCRWLITPVIGGKPSSFTSRLWAGATGIAEILFEQPVHLLRHYRGFHYRGSRNYFCVSPGNGRRQDILCAEPIADTISNITAQTIGDCSV